MASKANPADVVSLQEALNMEIIVNQALISNKKTFKKIARGQYTAA